MDSPRISLCMIVKDEAENLPRCLESVAGLVDEIIVVDTGSQDNTVEIAEKYGARVSIFPWTNSFSEARNCSLELATGDWILILDGDDELFREDIPNLKQLLTVPEVEAYFLQTVNEMGINDAETSLTNLTMRLFRNRPHYRYTGRIHEGIISSIMEAAGRDAIKVASQIRVRHYGYLKREVDKKGKASRNMALLQQELESRQPDNFLYYNLAVEYLRAGEYNKALEYFDLAEKNIRWEAPYASYLIRRKADCLALMNKKQEAILYLQQRTSIFPDYTDLYYQMAVLHLELKNYGQAVQLLERCIAMGEAPSNYASEAGVSGDRAWLAMADAYIKIGEKEKAVEVFRRQLIADSTNLQPLIRIIQLLLPLKGKEETIAYLNNFFHMATPAANLALADIFLAEGLPHQALDFLHKAIQLKAEGDYYNAVAGEVFLLCGDLANAKKHLSQIPANSDHYPRSARNLCLLYWLESSNDKAAAFLSGWPEAPIKKLYQACHSLIFETNSVRALSREEALPLIKAYTDLVNKLLLANKLSLAKKILCLGAREPELMLDLGKVFYRRGEEELALQWLGEALAAGYGDSQGALYLGDIYCKHQQWDKARQVYEQVLNWQLEDVEIHLAYARMYRQQTLSILHSLSGTEQVCALLQKNRPRISLCMIVKDEAEYLPRCLNSVREAVDEIIVVDTGSSDTTIQIAQQFGAKIYRYQWNNDFAAARNFSLDMATGEWLLVLDADEEFPKGEQAKIRSLLLAQNVEGYCFQLFNYYGHEVGHDFITDLVCRLFRNRPQYRFKRALHEQVVDQIIGVAGESAVKIAPVRIFHYGHLSSTIIKKNKSERNLAIIRRAVTEDPDNRFLRYSLGVELLNLGQYSQALEQLKLSYTPGLNYTSDVVLKMVICLKELRQFETGLQLIDNSMIDYPNFTDFLFLKGEIYMEQGNYAGAAQAFRSCLTMGEAPIYYSSTNGMGGYHAHYRLGKALEAMGNFEQAAASYQQALAANPKFHLPLYALAGMLRRIHPVEAVKQQLENCLSLPDVNAYLLLADIFTGTGDYAISLDYLKTALPLAGENQEIKFKAAYMEGICQARLGDYGAAIKAFEKVGQTSNYYLLALSWIWLLGWVQGDTRQSQEVLEAMKLVHGNTGQIYDFVHQSLLSGKLAESCNDMAETRATVETMMQRLKALGESSLAISLAAIGQNLTS
ncbi:MAG: glycosyltransferase [Bacillota bacterium]